MATEECSCNIPAKIWEWPPLAFRSVLWKGKCHFHFRKAAGFGWVFMTTTTTKNKSVQLFKNKEKEQLLAAHKLPTISQTCSSISSWCSSCSPSLCPAPQHSQQTCSRNVPRTPESGEAGARYLTPKNPVNAPNKPLVQWDRGQGWDGRWESKEQVVMSHRATAGAWSQLPRGGHPAGWGTGVGK